MSLASHVQPRRFECLAALALVLLMSVLFASPASADCQVPNCRTCAPNNEFFCEVCAGSDFIHSNGQCSPRGTCSITSCERCEDGSITRCAQCEPGYVRTGNGLCASLVVCDMDKCAPQEELRSRLVHSTVQCSEGETMKEEGVYVCVATQKGGRAAAVSTALLGGSPWWLYAAITTAGAVGFGIWVLMRLRKKA